MYTLTTLTARSTTSTTWCHAPLATDTAGRMSTRWVPSPTFAHSRSLSKDRTQPTLDPPPHDLSAAMTGLPVAATADTYTATLKDVVAPKFNADGF